MTGFTADSGPQDDVLTSDLHSSIGLTDQQALPVGVRFRRLDR